MIVLADLLPGVRYNCSIAAVNNAALSDLVYADETTTEIGRCIYFYTLVSRLLPRFVACCMKIGKRPAQLFLTCSLEKRILLNVLVVDTAWFTM